MEREEERTVTIYVYHPCYFLEEALRALLRCLGVEIGTNMGSQMKEEENSLPKPPSGAFPIVTSENASSSSQESSQEAADPPSTTSQSLENESLMARRGPRRPGLSQGSGPQHN